MLGLQTQNDRLKREISQERSQSQSFAMSHIEGYQEKNEAMYRQSQTLQSQLDEIKDENITLKLKLSDLESDLLEERQQKQLK